MGNDIKFLKSQNVENITAKDLAEIVKQMRYNQRRCKRNPTPEKLETLEQWESEVDAIVAIITDTQTKILW